MALSLQAALGSSMATFPFFKRCSGRNKPLALLCGRFSLSKYRRSDVVYQVFIYTDLTAGKLQQRQKGALDFIIPHISDRNDDYVSYLQSCITRQLHHSTDVQISLYHSHIWSMPFNLSGECV